MRGAVRGYGAVDERVDGGEGGAAAATDRARLVDSVFSAIARSYDLMNDVISLGTHRIAKRRVVAESGAAAGDRILDLGGGTGDITVRCSEAVPSAMLVVLADSNGEMLRIARRRIARRRIARRGAAAMSVCVAADALALPFVDDSFDRVLISFGLRNFAEIAPVLSAVRRVLRSGGSLVVLDFTTPPNRFARAAFRFYLDWIVPVAARIITGNARGYRYLAASVRMHPDAPALRDLMVEAGFRECSYRMMMNGVLALHGGRKG